jgi:hypothetical protein
LGLGRLDGEPMEPIGGDIEPNEPIGGGGRHRLRRRSRSLIFRGRGDVSACARRSRSGEGDFYAAADRADCAAGADGELFPHKGDGEIEPIGGGDAAVCAAGADPGRGTFTPPGMTHMRSRIGKNSL